MAEDVVVLQSGDERAQRIAKAMASQTANDMIQAFGARSMSSTEVAGHLKIPVTTATYHIENLLDAGILEVADTRWSKKGREVKVYGLTNQVLIIAPPVSDLRSVLQKYTALFAIVALASLALLGILPVLLPGSDGAMPAPTAAPLMGAGEKAADQFGITESRVADVPFASISIHDLVMAFFLGGCLVVFALMIYEIHYWWRSSPGYAARRKNN